MGDNTTLQGRAVYIVDGARTPFLKAMTGPGPFSASDMAVSCGQSLLARQPFKPEQLDEVIIGCMVPSEDEANIGRLIALRLGCGNNVPGWTVQRNCASGMQALDSAIKDIAIGRHDLILAGGTETMSRAPLIFPPGMAKWLVAWQKAMRKGGRLKTLTRFRLAFLKPIIALLHGLTDPLIGMSMPETAELIAYRFGITRKEMDEYSVTSQHRAANAEQNNLFSEIEPLYDHTGKVYLTDDGIRKDTDLEKLTKLKSIVNRRYGIVTAGNSSQITDGAALLLLASQEAVEKHNLPVMGEIKDVQWSGLAPELMGLGPVYSSTAIMQRQLLALDDIDYWEINEAFAGQVLGCLAAWDSNDFCTKQLGLEQKVGCLNLEKLNIDGGAIALGHPVGASGARIVLHLLHVLARKQARLGMATLCIGGGQGGSMLLERS